MVLKNRGNYFKIQIEDKKFLFSFVLVDITDMVKEDMSKREYKKLINNYLKYITINYGDDIYFSPPVELDSDILEDLEFKESLTLSIDKKDYKKLDKIIKSAIIKELEKYKVNTIQVYAGNENDDK